VPIQGRRIYGEIDIDSHTPNAFHEYDQKMLEGMAKDLAEFLDANM
jgi:putative methionine-R-sulfoxide reductase with GAF domain